MAEQEWPTKQADMKMVHGVLRRLDSGEGKTLMSVENLGDGETMQFTPSPWLGEITMNLVRRHGEEKGMGILRLVLREIGLFNKRGNERGNA